MDFTLTAAQAELRDRARQFVGDTLQPLEAEFERGRGTLSVDALVVSEGDSALA